MADIWRRLASLLYRLDWGEPNYSIHDRHQQNGKPFCVIQVILDRGKNTYDYIAFNILAAQTGKDRDMPPFSIGPHTRFNDLKLDSMTYGIEVLLDEPNDGLFCNFFFLP